MKHSIIILTFNHADYISECLESALSIKNSELEILVLDDGSTDRTLDILRQFEKNFPQVRVISQENSSKIGLNTKKLLQSTTGELITFMAGDDYFVNGFPIDEIQTAFQEDPDSFIIFTGGQVSSGGKKQSINSRNLSNLLESGRPSEVLRKHLFRRVSRLFLQGATIRRNLLNLTGLPSEDPLDDDYEFIFRIFLVLERERKRFVYLPEAHWEYRIHETNLHKNGLRQLESTLHTISKYVPRSKRLIFRYDVPRLVNFSQTWLAINVIKRYFQMPTSGFLSMQVLALYLVDNFLQFSKKVSSVSKNRSTKRGNPN